jgi:hypothetical protein
MFLSFRGAVKEAENVWVSSEAIVVVTEDGVHVILCFMKILKILCLPAAAAG